MNISYEVVYEASSFLIFGESINIGYKTRRVGRSLHTHRARVSEKKLLRAELESRYKFSIERVLFASLMY